MKKFIKFTLRLAFVISALPFMCVGTIAGFMWFEFKAGIKLAKEFIEWV